MAKAGDELVNPVAGLRTVFRKTAQDTSGELLQVDWIGEPGWTTGPNHVHPRQEERFEVLAGKLDLRVGDVERVHSAGDVIMAPAGSAHAAWNAGDNLVHALVDFRPTLRTETAFETLAGLAHDGKTNRAGAPKNPLRLDHNSARRPEPTKDFAVAFLWMAASWGRVGGYCATPATVVHADLHPLIHLSGDAAPPGRAVRSLVEAVSGGCALR